MKDKTKKIIQNHTLLFSIAIVLSTALVGLSIYNSRTSEEKANFVVKKDTNNKYAQTYTLNENENTVLDEIENKAEAADSVACGINPSADCADLIFGDPDVEFSETFLTIMAATGRTFNTPSAVLLAYMKSIHSLGRFSYLFSVEGEEELKKSYHWGGQIKGCDELDPMEQGPYDWIWNWFAGILESGNAATYLDALSEGRSNAASRCNFIDASFVAASHFSDVGCDANWANLVNQLKSLTWGTGELEESYAEDNRYGVGMEAWEVFNKCRGR